MLYNVALSDYDTATIHRYTLDIQAPKPQVEKILYRRARMIAREHHGWLNVAVSYQAVPENAHTLTEAANSAKALNEHCTANTMKRKAQKLAQKTPKEFQGLYSMLESWKARRVHA